MVPNMYIIIFLQKMISHTVSVTLVVTVNLIRYSIYNCNHVLTN